MLALTYSDCRGTELDSFERVFDLEQTPFGREGALIASGTTVVNEKMAHQMLILDSSI